jgi:hypothetical protein
MLIFPVIFACGLTECQGVKEIGHPFHFRKYSQSVSGNV